MTNLLLLIAGLACAAAGGELFVRGAVAVTRLARVPAAIVGVTVAAFATSSPELAVAVRSALKGIPEVSFGDVAGSNVANVGLILGVGLLVGPIRCPAGAIRRDFPLAGLVAVGLAFLAWDGTVSRVDGLLLLAGFSFWLFAVIREAQRSRMPADKATPVSATRAGFFLAGGLILLVAAGHCVVKGAVGVGLSLGLSTFVIGATMVAVGTSIPELATTVVSQIRREDHLGLGNILGSNIFNALFIVGVAAVIHPIRVARTQTSWALGFAFALPLLTWPGKSGSIARARGALLLALYAAYLAGVLR